MSLISFWKCNICSENMQSGYGVKFFSFHAGNFTLESLDSSLAVHICTLCARTLSDELRKKGVEKRSERNLLQQELNEEKEENL